MGGEGGRPQTARILYYNILLPNNQLNIYIYISPKELLCYESGELWTDICTDVVRREATL